MKRFFFTLLMGLFSAPLFANPIVSSPVAGTTTSPVSLIASAASCSGVPVVSMGYSIDSSTNTTVVSGTSVKAAVAVPLGAHLLHVKSWGKHVSCVTTVSLNVVATPTAPVTNVVVTSPASALQTTSPVQLTAAGTECQSQPIVAFGYSVDSSTNTTVVQGQSVTAQVQVPSGSHVLHVKAWGKGVVCVTDRALTIAIPPPPPPPPATPSGPTIPSTAIAIKDIQNLLTWKTTYDVATGGSGATATGNTLLTTSPSLSGSARSFETQFSNYGGERYSIRVGADNTSTHFIYDAWVYLQSPSSAIANVELDSNQVLANGDTMIYAFQCDGWSNTWDYSENAGSVASPNVKWLHSTQPCNPRKWTTDTWHHVQISYSRDDSGNVTYESVWFDGVEQPINETVPSEFGLGWDQTIVENVQIDGATSTDGAATILVDNFTLYRW